MLLIMFCIFFFFKQKTAYEMRISDWSSDVCSSDLIGRAGNMGVGRIAQGRAGHFALGRFGNQVYAAADTAATRRRAVQERARAIDDLHRGKEFGRHQLARGDAIEAVEADVVRRQVEAADDENFAGDTEADRSANRRTILNS